MNGFVESFRILEQSAPNGHVQIKAEVQISTSGIENFVLSGGKGSARIDTRGVCSHLEALKRILWGLSRSTIFLRISHGTFPTPVSLCARAVGWIESEIDEWLVRRIIESRSASVQKTAGRVDIQWTT